MLRPTTFFLFVLLLPLHATAQHEGDNWVFGWNAGLRFKPGGAFSYFSGSQNTREGISCISDKNTGDLLFYTDGIQVWDRNHNTMPNGNGLWGNYSAAQSGVIIPKPGSDTRYYIFTAPQINQITTPYTFSEVDMTGNNGLGDVLPATKNTPIGADATEKLTVARHCNNRDFWVIMRHANGNRFSVRLVDASGVQAAKSFNLGGYVDNSTWTKANYLKLSLDQSLLIHPIGPASLGSYDSVVEIYDFDNATGTISGPKLTIDGFSYAYAAELSADNRLMYVSDISTQGTSYIYQFNLGLGSAQAIKASKTQLVSSNRYDYGALQTGPDGKIYAAKEDGYNFGATALDVIQAPGVPGTGCAYQEDGLPLLSGQSLIGLPNFPNYVFRKYPAIAFTRNCNTDAFQFSLANTVAGSSVSWQFDDPGSGSSNSAIGIAAAHTFSAEGQYTVRAIQNSPCGSDTLTATVTVVDFLPIADTAFCQGGSITLTGPAPNTTWNNTTVGPTFTVTQGGPVSYQFTDAYGCLINEVVLVQESAPVSISETLPLCLGDTLFVFGQPVTQGGTFSSTFTAVNGCDSVHVIEVVEVQDTINIYENLNVCRGDTLYRFGSALFKNGDYNFLLPFGGRCVIRHIVTVTVRDLPVLSVITTADGCKDNPTGAIQISDLGPGTQIRLEGGNWLPGSTFTGLDAGSYLVTVRDSYGCIGEANVEVPKPAPYLVRLTVDTTLADCGVVTLQATHTSVHPVMYNWSPAAGLNCTDCQTVVATLATDMVYTVSAIDTAGCTAVASIEVPYRELIHLYAPNVFSPNDDGRNDRFTLYGNLCLKTIRYLSIFDRWGGQIFYRTGLIPGDENRGWDGWWKNEELNPGVFTWIAEVELYNGAVTRLSGTVTLVR